MNQDFRRICVVALVVLGLQTPVHAAPKPSEMVKPRSTFKVESSRSSVSSQTIKNQESPKSTEAQDASSKEKVSEKNPEAASKPEPKETAKDDKNPPAAPPGASSSAGITPNVQAASVHVDPFVGSANLGIPIQVPPGRGGIQPELALSYSSSNRGLGLAGVGWSLDLGSIQRSTKKGVSSYFDNEDQFILTQGSSQELIAGPNYYYPEIEGSFAKIEHIDDHWLVTDKKGTKYYFGNTDDSRQYDPQYPSHIFRWALNRVEDLNGNYMTITYMRDGNQIYPQTINYTGNSQQSLAPYAKVTITYADASQQSVSYMSGFKVSNAKRIDQIKTSVNSINQSTYLLTYKQSASTQRDLLQSIQQFGADGITSLPAVTFSYTDTAHTEYKEDTSWDLNNISYFTRHTNYWLDYGLRVGDFNGDGYSDIIQYSSEWSSGLSTLVRLNNKHKNWDSSDSWKLSMTMVPGAPEGFLGYNNDVSRYNGVTLLDFNGDGLVDSIQNFKRDPYYGGGGYYIKSARINDGQSGYAQDSAWELPDDALINYEYNQPSYGYTAPGSTEFADVNGDGFVDVLVARGSPYRSFSTFLNNKGKYLDSKGWTYTSKWPMIGLDFVKDGSTMVDLNGDGLSDIIQIIPGDIKVCINTSNGWEQDFNSLWMQYIPSSADLRDGKTFFADINGDGLVDLIVGAKVYLNTGNGWRESGIEFSANSNFSNHSSMMLEANADGMMDYIVSSFEQGKSMYINQGKPVDMLNQINNGIGASTDIVYDSSAHYQNIFMPMIMQVVKSTTTSDGFGHSYTTNYSYAKGKWDATYREFQGFGEVKVIDADGNYTQTTFAQDHWLKGRPLEQAAYDAAGKLYNKSVNQWKTQDIATNATTGQTSKFVYLWRSDNYIYDGTPTARRTAQEMIYGENPQYGNPTQVINYGDVDPATGNDTWNDKIVTKTEYVSNTSKWILGLPKRVYVQDITNKTVAQTWFNYDGASDNNSSPTFGRLTTKINGLGVTGMPDPKTSYTYDVYGNLLTTTDALGNKTSVTYDTDVRLFPVTVTNQLNQISKTTYYGVAGQPLNDGHSLQGLWGQPKSVTDVNNKVSYSSFDTFGRPLTAISPKDSVALPSVLKSYQIFSKYMSVTTKTRVDHGLSGTIDSVEYYDGLGRLLQAKSLGPKAGQFIVSGQSEYNNRGLPVKKYLPRFTSNNLGVMDPIDPGVPSSKTTYDAMGRVLYSTNPDGSFSSVTYDHGMTRVVDENGHMNKSYVDAAGRLTKKEEYTGADGRSADYAKTSFYTLYATTKYIYDAVGNLISVIDAKNNVTTISYDALGRKTGMVDPDMGTWAYQYDDNGNLIEQRDALNKKIQFSYDPLNRLKVKTSIVSPTSLQQVFYGYDQANQANALGRLNSVLYGNDSAGFTYDELGREIQSTKVINNTTYKVTRQYDALNRLKQLQYPDTAQIKYLYNQAGQVVSVIDAASNYQYVKSIDYNATGQMTQIQYGNGVTTAYTYDPVSFRLKRIYTANTAAKKLQDLTYEYDAAGQIKKITDVVNTGTQTFKYDDLNRLIQAVGAYGTKTYAYDQIGNITLKDGLSYQYGLNAGVHAVTSTSDGTTYRYNPNGNMIAKQTSKGFWSYVYDLQNRLTAVGYQPMAKPVKKIAEYYYDGDGGRTRKVVYRYLDPAYRNDDTKDIFFTQMGNIDFGPNDVVTSQTTYVGNLYEIEDTRKTRNIFLGSTRIAAVTGAEVDFYHMDHLGSANVISDATGASRSLSEYDPFGKLSRFERTGAKIKTGWEYFNDKPFDDETGLIFYGARYYDPKLGRFITPDTVVQAPSNPQTLSRYSYCSNNPVNRVDPSGHSWFSKLFKKVVNTIAPYIGFVGTLLNNAVNNDWSQIGRQIAVAGISAAASFLMPGFGALSSNLFINIGLHAVIGAAEGALIGGISSMIMGGTFTQGVIAGAIGGAIGGGIQGVTTSQQFGNWQAGNGFRSDRDVRIAQYEKEINSMRALNVNNTDGTVDVVSRPLAKADGMPGSTTGPRHMDIRDKWQMGPEKGLIQTTDTAGKNWGTEYTSNMSEAMGGRYAISQEVAVNMAGLDKAISLYDKTFRNMPYNAFDHNSNYAVRSVLYAAGARNVDQIGYHAPGFPDGP